MVYTHWKIITCVSYFKSSIKDHLLYFLLVLFSYLLTCFQSELVMFILFCNWSSSFRIIRCKKIGFFRSVFYCCMLRSLIIVIILSVLTHRWSRGSHHLLYRPLVCGVLLIHFLTYFHKRLCIRCDINFQYNCEKEEEGFPVRLVGVVGKCPFCIPGPTSIT